MKEMKKQKSKSIPIEQSFGYKRPELVKYWHPTLNTEKSPYEVGEKSKYNAWWLMDCGHFFQTKVSDFTKSQTCRVCSNLITMKGQNDLVTTHPHLVKLWDYELNTVDPTEITASYGGKVWWLCLKDDKHKYERPVNVQVRTHKGSCPICTNSVITEGMNSLRDTHPEVAKHYDDLKNKKTAGEVTSGSPGSFKWICDCGNSFSRKMSNAIKTQLCRECLQKQKKEVSYNNRFNKVAKGKFELLKPYVAYVEEIEIKHISCGKTFKVNPEDFIRTPKCSCCEKFKVLKKGENDLASQKPLVAKYFNVEKNGVTPSEVFASGSIIYWWKWDCGHELQEKPSGMRNTEECPICKQEAHRKKIKKNSAKVDLSNLPYKKGCKGRDGVIEWTKCEGLSFKALYKGIWYEILIKEVVKEGKEHKIILYSKEFGFYKVRNNAIKNGRLTAYFEGDRSEFAFEVGADVSAKNGEMKVISRYRTGLNKKYICKCSVCEHEANKFEEELYEGVGCGVCSGAIFKQGVNDIATKASWMIPWLKDKEDAYKYSKSANQKTFFKCIHCGHEKEVLISNFSKKGMSCICGDGVSIPEKFIHNVLTQLNVCFEYQFSPEWAGNRFYDFYDYKLDFIIETHGSQHFKETYRYKTTKKKGGKVRTLEEEQENDRIKKELANENQISIYLELDCRHSDFNFLKNSVEDSVLNEVYDLSKINWEEVYNFCLTSRMMECIELFNQGLLASDIVKKTGYDRTAVIQYLRKGTAAGKCYYDPKEQHAKGVKEKYMNPIKCVETGEIFQNAVFAAEKLTSRYGKLFKNSAIANAANGNIKTHHGMRFEKVTEEEWLNYIPIKEEDITYNPSLERNKRAYYKVNKFVDLSNIEKKETKSKTIYNWRSSIGREVPFKYGTIEGVITITDYSSDEQRPYVKIKTDDYGEYWIYTGSLRDGKLAKYLKAYDQTLIKQD